MPELMCDGEPIAQLRCVRGDDHREVALLPDFERLGAVIDHDFTTQLGEQLVNIDVAVRVDDFVFVRDLFGVRRDR